MVGCTEGEARANTIAVVSRGDHAAHGAHRVVDEDCRAYRQDAVECDLVT